MYEKDKENKKKRGVNMPPTTAPSISKFKGKKKPDKAATASLKADKLAMSKISRGRKETKTYSWDEVFGD